MTRTYSPAQGRASKKWNDENYERLDLRVPKGMNEEIKLAAAAQGYKSKRAFCIDAIMEKMNQK